jgi:hypothetical protein
MRMLLAWVAALVLCACSNGPKGGTGGGGGSSSTTLKFALIEASGELSVTAESSICNRKTTSSVVKFALPAVPGKSGATYSPSSGLYLSPSIQLTIQPRVGTENCFGTARTCPNSPDTVQTSTTSLSLKSFQPKKTSGEAAPTVLFPSGRSGLKRESGPRAHASSWAASLAAGLLGLGAIATGFVFASRLASSAPVTTFEDLERAVRLDPTDALTRLELVRADVSAQRCVEARPHVAVLERQLPHAQLGKLLEAGCEVR